MPPRIIEIYAMRYWKNWKGDKTAMANKFDKIKETQKKGGLLDVPEDNNIPGQMTMPVDYPETAPEQPTEEKPKSKHKLSSFYLSAEDYDLYKRYATAKGMTLSKLIGIAVSEYVQNGIKLMSNKEMTLFELLKK